MEHARLLIDIYGGYMQMFEIAEKCGYTDYIYFSKQFKKHMGKSPGKYKIKVYFSLYYACNYGIMVLGTMIKNHSTQYVFFLI